METLHSLLITGKKLAGQAQSCRLDLQNSMAKKTHLFQEKLVTFTPNAENGVTETREQSSIQTTVQKEAAWLSEMLVKALDGAYAIDVANTQACADIVLEDGVVLAKAVPATALLQLEHRVAEIQEFVNCIPTLDPANGFELDPARGPGIYKARERVEYSTKKEQRPLVLAPATEKHAAQVQLIVEDVRVGQIQKLEWSSLITPATKSDLLGRCEMLFRAVAQARTRANDYKLETRDQKIGAALLGFVFKPLAATGKTATT